jgi:hypothetical protein
VKLNYEKVLDKKLMSLSKLHALMDKVMDQIRKDHNYAFTKHLLVCDLALGPEFLK